MNKKFRFQTALVRGQWKQNVEISIFEDGTIEEHRLRCRYGRIRETDRASRNG